MRYRFEPEKTFEFREILRREGFYVLLNGEVESKILRTAGQFEIGYLEDSGQKSTFTIPDNSRNFPDLVAKEKGRLTAIVENIRWVKHLEEVVKNNK